jgi:hypothetical protein
VSGEVECGLEAGHLLVVLGVELWPFEARDL